MSHAVRKASIFHNYRVLRMNEAPSIEVHLVRNDEAPSGGRGWRPRATRERSRCLVALAAFMDVLQVTG
jgi:hypothetical protein